MKHLLPILALFLLPSSAFGQDACEIQRELRKRGYFQGEITCNIGDKTRDAIRMFQADEGLAEDGVAGSDTVKRLFASRDNDRKSPRVVERRERSDQEEFAQCGDELIEQSVERLGKGRALTGAKKSWESKVYSTEGLGIRYGDWANATDKSEECFPASAGSRFTWNCTVRARPCKQGGEAR